MRSVGKTDSLPDESLAVRMVALMALQMVVRWVVSKAVKKVGLKFDRSALRWVCRMVVQSADNLAD